MPKLLKTKRDDRASLTSQRQAIVEEGERLNALETLTEEQSKRLEDLSIQRTSIDTQLQVLDSQIEVLEGVADEMRENFPGGDGSPRQLQDPRMGFENYGEFCAAVARAATSPHALDERLATIQAAAPTTYGNEGSGADGGYMVPPEFSAEVRSHSLEEAAFLPMTDNTPVSGNSMAFPRTEVTPWGATGAKAYWRAEAAEATQSKLVLGTVELRLNELTALVPMTQELLDDAPAMGQRISRETGESIRWITNDAIVNGTGAGQPTGFLGHSSEVVVAKESGQTADTVNVQNIAKMWSRQLNPLSAVWVLNPDVWPQLIEMTIGNQPIFTPPNAGIAGAPGGFLMGRPIIPSDTHHTLGDKGDISFVNFGAYASITKASGIQTDTSMHLWFDQNMVAFRAIFRVDGKPWLKDPVTPPRSSATRSPFVVLADRA